MRERNFAVAATYFLLALVSAASAASPASAATSAPSTRPTLELTTDHPDAIYKTGEVIRFRPVLKRVGGRDDGGAETHDLHYSIVADGDRQIAGGALASAPSGPPEIIASLPKPGFVRCEVSFKSRAATRPTTMSIGAAVEPDKIAPSLPVPEDFDAFWSAQKKLLADHPAETKLIPVKSTDPAIEAFDVQIPGPQPGTNVSGYFARPIGAKPKSLPAILYPHSAGVRDSDLPHAIRGAKLGAGAIALDFNAHGVPNAQPPEFYKDLLNGALSDHRVRGMQDREKVYFRGMYLRVLRALDFLTKQPEWDGRILIVEGSSQGGGQALVAAGLDPRVTLCLASVPALCDLTGPVAGRESGWPKMLKPAADGSLDEKAVQALRYVDAMNFASRIRCQTIVSVGFVDKTCPPSSVCAAFNNIPATTDKTLVMRPTMGHQFPPDLIAAWDDVIRAHIAEMRK